MRETVENLVKNYSNLRLIMISFNIIFCFNHGSYTLSQTMSNSTIELKYKLSLQRMESDIMGDQLKRLYDAISFLGEGKKHADKK